MNTSTPSFMLIELTIGLPWMQRRPASITLHLELSTMIGTRAMSGSPAIRFRKRTMAASLSSMASSMLMSITCAPFSTCWRATANACSNAPLRIMRAKALEPVTLVRSPTLTNRLPSPMRTGSRPESFMGGMAGVAGAATGVMGSGMGLTWEKAEQVSVVASRSSGSKPDAWPGRTRVATLLGSTGF